MKVFQAALQWLFMRVEALFNRAFGDRINPLYHLGSITFFLFWIVGGSGLYLYAFFETGVSGAHDSVLSITHGQWWLGGILRSVHRYASDAMVLTMVLHMLRYFAFNLFHGFRWFSWVTGVALIWLVYASGANGYMLPWDALAQYVTVSSFECLDWLPPFSGTLMRNFVYADSVSDRFFSLLSFLHIGLPLVVLLLMWIHVQRVPKARTTPPRPIVIGLVLTFLVMALVAPVDSQGGAADLARAVMSVKLDWFLLAIYPLISQWPLGKVWALVSGVTLVLLLLPLWPQPRRKGQGTLHATVRGEDGSAAEFTLRPGETLLDAGLRDGLALPYECRNGACGLCLCSIEQGTVEHRPYQKTALSDAQLARGLALMCCAVPNGDVVIAVDGFTGASAAEVPQYEARVVHMEHLADDVMRLRLELPGAERLPFEAGQYIDIVLEDGQRRAFSFANPPQNNALIELHVRLVPGGRFTTHVFDGMQVGDTVTFEGPRGQFTLRDGTEPILFIAGATGFAPIKSILEDAFARGITRPMRLYWGVRDCKDLYLLSLCEAWQREHSNFSVVPVVSEPVPGDGWEGRIGLVHEAMLDDFPDLSGHEVYLCGSVRMVEAAVPAFLAQGLAEGACFSDAFVPAARPVSAAVSEPGAQSPSV
jgi:NAD(P)H-flavin reductase/quinol-cytochrome oxidoreductase complex cytochrome b subunit/ferredoxin